MSTLQSWGRLLPAHSGLVWRPDVRFSTLPETGTGGLLAYGQGRSYGDVCLNTGGTLLHTSGLNRFIAFNRATGILRCEAGVTLREILALVVPQGWFLAVTPGTRDVTVGGAIANDVHGKNHHSAGSFGHYVLQMELLRSAGERLLLSPQQQPELFAATVGGLGLTGLVVWAALQLVPINHAFMTVETTRFANLDEFWLINAQAEKLWPYTVAWIDCLAKGAHQGRGIFMAGRHAAAQNELPVWKESGKTVPLTPPISLVNGLSLRAFNTLYWHRAREGVSLSHYAPYFYPLDSISHWNRIYGRAGFYQYQCVLPPETMQTGIAELLNRIARSGEGSFLAVLKTFGQRPSVGLLSFPRPGATLALDFPNRGARSLKLFHELDAVVRDAHGAIYPAKDARMPAALFQQAYPQWTQFAQWIDPAFSSDFWKRVTQS
jgi:FAD/FMN-containing dehydrogenase